MYMYVPKYVKYHNIVQEIVMIAICMQVNKHNGVWEPLLPKYRSKSQYTKIFWLSMHEMQIAPPVCDVILW